MLGMFYDMAAGRGSSGFGPLPLALVEIEAWYRLSGTPLSWWEVQVLRLLDRAWISAWSAGQPKGQ